MSSGSIPAFSISMRSSYGVIEHWGRGLSLIFEECERAGLQQPKVTDERGVVRVTFYIYNEKIAIIV